MFNADFHRIYVLMIMIIFPIAFALIEFSRRKNGFYKLILKWVTFWTIGVRALTSGFMQFANPQYTMKLLNLGTESAIIIRELGFLQFAIGLIAILSIRKKAYIEPIFICYGIFMLGASYLHISRISYIDFGELVSLIGDLLVVAIIMIYFIKMLLNNEDKAKNES